LLTNRKTEVLRHLTLGLANRPIARVLAVTEGAVKSHVAHFLTKLHAANRVQAAVIAKRIDLVV
jgi:two-component system, NarL family, nitrate/nitrite response regulator NarL